MEEERRRKKKGNHHRTAKAQCRGRGLSQKYKVWLNIYINIYTHNKIKTVQQKLSIKDWHSKQRKPKIMSTRTKLTKALTGKQNESKMPIWE